MANMPTHFADLARLADRLVVHMGEVKLKITAKRIREIKTRVDGLHEMLDNATAEGDRNRVILLESEIANPPYSNQMQASYETYLDSVYFNFQEVKDIPRDTMRLMLTCFYDHHFGEGFPHTDVTFDIARALRDPSRLCRMPTAEHEENKQPKSLVLIHKEDNKWATLNSIDKSLRRHFKVDDDPDEYFKYWADSIGHWLRHGETLGSQSLRDRISKVSKVQEYPTLLDILNFIEQTYEHSKVLPK